MVAVVLGDLEHREGLLRGKGSFNIVNRKNWKWNISQTMVGQLKEDVAEWYQGLSADMRIEAMCTLIDLSLPFEIRFLGSLIEHLGRKDFACLRDAESKANSFANGNPDDKQKLLRSLGEVAPLAVANGTQYVNPLMQTSNNFSDTPANRPSPTHVADSKGRPPTSSSVADSSHGSVDNDHESSANHIGFNGEDEAMCIVNDHKRRKLILYISVLSPTNHDGANLYYTVLSDIEDSTSLTWLEDLEKDAQEEVSLLYTLASRHPAFTFEQRMFLGTVASRVNEIVGPKFSTRPNATLSHQAPHAMNSNPGPHPVFYNHTGIPQPVDPKYGAYYIFAPPMHIQQSHQPSSSVPSNGEQIRNSAVPTPFPAYASFGPYFLPHPHPPPSLPHPTPLNPPFTQSMIPSSIPIPAPATTALVGGSGQKLTQSQTTLAPTPCSNNNPIAQCNNAVGANTTVAAVNHQVVPSASQQNCVPGDSAEESSENCDWNSPESSPFESPPQSLSRSHSPPSGVPNSTLVQTVTTSSVSQPPQAPPSQNNFPCYSTISFGSMNSAYRGNSQGVLTRSQFSQPIVHNSLRQKSQIQNTPKRRNSTKDNDDDGTRVFGHTGAPFLPNGYMTSSFYAATPMGAAAMGGPPFTIPPHSFTNPVANNKMGVIPPLEDLGETIHKPRKISCYNCGLHTHLGPDCKDGSMEEMTRRQFRVNYSGPSPAVVFDRDGNTRKAGF